ncbi:MAG: FAD-binding protein [Terriglobia bacterium]
MNWVSELAKEIGGQALTDAASLSAAASDFGHVVERCPATVVRPASAEDVAKVIQFAGGHSLRVTARGAGHSQSGQSLSDQIVLDMRSLDHIIHVDREQLKVRCQAGVTWRALLTELLPLGLSPPVLTNNLDVTVGGTLSTAGIGVASWRYGTQADQCLELEVVTGKGEIVRCSPTSESRLFDGVRAGLGLFGVITEATLRLRRHKSKIKTFYLLYDELDTLLRDLERIMVDSRFDHLESWCVPLPQGFRQGVGGRQPFATWFFPLHLTLEHDGDHSGNEDHRLRGLSFYKHIHTEDGEIGDFFLRLDPLFALWKQAGFWDRAHPWMECMLPWEASSGYVRNVLASIPPSSLQGGHALLWPARGAASSIPLFMRPAADYVIGFGILPAIQKSLLPEFLPLLETASRGAMLVGGKRYLSGWLGFDSNAWKSHYGGQWTLVRDLKRQFDPLNVLGMDSIQF